MGEHAHKIEPGFSDPHNRQQARSGFRVIEGGGRTGTDELDRSHLSLVESTPEEVSKDTFWGVAWHGLKALPKQFTKENANRWAHVGKQILVGALKNLSGKTAIETYQKLLSTKGAYRETEHLMQAMLHARKDMFAEGESEKSVSKDALRTQLEKLNAIKHTLSPEQRKRVAEVLVDNRTRKLELRAGIERSMSLRVKEERLAVAEKSLSPMLLGASATTGPLGALPAVAIRATINTLQKQATLQQEAHRDSRLTNEEVAVGVRKAFSVGMRQWVKDARAGKTSAIVKGGLYGVSGTLGALDLRELLGVSVAHAEEVSVPKSDGLKALQKVYAEETGTSEVIRHPSEVTTQSEPARPVVPQATADGGLEVDSLRSVRVENADGLNVPQRLDGALGETPQVPDVPDEIETVPDGGSKGLSALQKVYAEETGTSEVIRYPSDVTAQSEPARLAEPHATAVGRPEVGSLSEVQAGGDDSLDTPQRLDGALGETPQVPDVPDEKAGASDADRPTGAGPKEYVAPELRPEVRGAQPSITETPTLRQPEKAPELGEINTERIVKPDSLTEPSELNTSPMDRSFQYTNPDSEEAESQVASPALKDPFGASESFTVDRGADSRPSLKTVDRPVTSAPHDRVVSVDTASEPLPQENLTIAKGGSVSETLYEAFKAGNITGLPDMSKTEFLSKMYKAIHELDNNSLIMKAMHIPSGDLDMVQAGAEVNMQPLMDHIRGVSTEDIEARIKADFGASIEQDPATAPEPVPRPEFTKTSTDSATATETDPAPEKVPLPKESKMSNVTDEETRSITAGSATKENVQFGSEVLSQKELTEEQIAEITRNLNSDALIEASRVGGEFYNLLESTIDDVTLEQGLRLEDEKKSILLTEFASSYIPSDITYNEMEHELRTIANRELLFMLVSDVGAIYEGVTNDLSNVSLGQFTSSGDIIENINNELSKKGLSISTHPHSGIEQLAKLIDGIKDHSLITQDMTLASAVSELIRHDVLAMEHEGHEDRIMLTDEFGKKAIITVGGMNI